MLIVMFISLMMLIQMYNEREMICNHTSQNHGTQLQ